MQTVDQDLENVRERRIEADSEALRTPPWFLLISALAVFTIVAAYDVVAPWQTRLQISGIVIVVVVLVLYARLRKTTPSQQLTQSNRWRLAAFGAINGFLLQFLPRMLDAFGLPLPGVLGGVVMASICVFGGRWIDRMALERLREARP